MILFDGNDAVLDAVSKAVVFQRVGTDMVERWRAVSLIRFHRR